MKLFLMRHAEAESGEPNEPTRPLTEAGRKQLAVMGAFMARMEGTVDCIVTSYFVRALDTAKAMGAALGCTVIHETPWLCPDAPVEKAWQDLQRLGKNSDSVLVVTHHPLINELLKRACGDADSHFEHAGIAHIKDATLRWFVSPKLIARDESDAGVIEAALKVIDSSIRELDAGNIWDIDRIPEAMLAEAGKYTYEETLMKRVLPGPSASGTCEYCEDNIDAGWIDSEEPYPTGDDGPGFHPNCACEEFYRVGRVRVYESGLRVREGWEGDVIQIREGWVTINGAHVFINDLGMVTKGPKAFIGQSHKSLIAKAAHKGGSKAEQDIAEQTEHELSSALGMTKSANNKPFDLFTKKVGVEVKTLTTGTNDKITMKAEAVARKDAGVKEMKLARTYTVVVDKRPAGVGASTGQTRYFVRAGYGSFRVGSMTEVSGAAGLAKFMKL